MSAHKAKPEKHEDHEDHAVEAAKKLPDAMSTLRSALNQGTTWAGLSAEEDSRRREDIETDRVNAAKSLVELIRLIVGKK